MTVTTRTAAPRAVRVLAAATTLAAALTLLGRCESDAPRIDIWSAPTIQEATR